MENTELLTKIMDCTDAAYIIDDKTGKILFKHDSDSLHFYDCDDAYCWQTILGRGERCAFCPGLALGERYSWDYYDSKRKLWYKIVNVLFEEDGKVYRAGIISTINDAMGLNRDAVAEMTELNRLLEENGRIKNAFEREANYDKMTGLYNRNRYRLDIASGVYDCMCLGVLYFDLNNLKTVNDTYRHEAGDRLIVCLSDALKETAADMPDSTVYRIGGDEFVLFVKNTSEGKLSALTAKFKSILKRLNDGQPIQCSVAVGRAYSNDKCDAELIVSEADKNMYTVKKAMKEKDGSR